MCEHTGVIGDFALVFHDILREHSVIGQRDYLATEAANSFSTVASPE